MTVMVRAVSIAAACIILDREYGGTSDTAQGVHRPGRTGGPEERRHTVEERDFFEIEGYG